MIDKRRIAGAYVSVNLNYEDFVRKSPAALTPVETGPGRDRAGTERQMASVSHAWSTRTAASGGFQGVCFGVRRRTMWVGSAASEIAPDSAKRSEEMRRGDLRGHGRAGRPGGRTGAGRSAEGGGSARRNSTRRSRGRAGATYFLRCRMRLRIRRFFRPTLRRPFPRRRLAIRAPVSGWTFETPIATTSRPAGKSWIIPAPDPPHKMTGRRVGVLGEPRGVGKNSAAPSRPT